MTPEEVVGGREADHPTRRRVALLLAAAATLLVFLFSVRLLGRATEAAAPYVEDAFLAVVVGDAGALGAAWLATYLITNGSVVAALSLTLFAAEIVTATQVFLMVAGSRLGGAAIVLVIGGLEFLRKRRFSLQRATSLGVLTFLVTLSIYLPATVLGYLALPTVTPALTDLSRTLGVDVRPLTVFRPVTDGVLGLVGPFVGFLVGLGLLFACLDVFDRLLGRVETETLRRRFFTHLRRRWLSFGIGLLVTSLTTSVAFSLGVIVPLYNRDYVTRREILPYILGANVGTLLDTLVVAAVLGSEAGVVAVTALIGSGLLVTVLALAVYERYFAAVAAVQDRLRGDRRLFLAFLSLLALVPAALVLLAALAP